MNTDEHSFAKIMVGAIASLLLVTGQASAQPCAGYEVTAIVTMDECPPFGVPPVVPFGINEEGWMVGFFQPCVIGPDRAFLWTPDDGLIVIPTPAGTSRSRALAISGSRVVGWYDNADLELGTAGFLYDFESKQFTSLGTLPGGNTSFANGINSAGEIVGSWGDVVKGPFPQAFIWRDGEMIDINPDLGADNSDANDINGAGVITGWSRKDGGERIAFVWEDGEVNSLGPIPEGFSSTGEAINQRGHVAGEGKIVLDDRETIVVQGFLWTDNEMTNLGTLPGTTFARPRGIDDQDRVVGYCHNELLTDQAAFIWQDGVIAALNDLIPFDSNLNLKLAMSMNHAGQIAGSATNEFGDLVAVLLTRVQGPPSDLNNDCQVGVADLLILLSDWGPCDNCEDCTADLDDNCVVGIADLLILLANWG